MTDWDWCDYFDGKDKEKQFRLGERLIAAKGCVNIRRREWFDLEANRAMLTVCGSA